MSVNSPIVLKLPIMTLSPIFTLSSITLYAPMVTLEPIFAFLETILVGWIELLIFCSCKLTFKCFS